MVKLGRSGEKRKLIGKTYSVAYLFAKLYGSVAGAENKAG
jgi:hypothetical protein